MRLHFLLLLLFSHFSWVLAQENKANLSSLPDFSKPVIRFIRVYGEKSELDPPVIVVGDERTAVSTGLRSDKIVIEFDVASKVPPSLFARFVHCSYDWKEDEKHLYQRGNCVPNKQYFLGVSPD